MRGDEVQWCKICLMPSTRPRVEFHDGLCNGCQYHASLGEVDWGARGAEFVRLLEDNPGNGEHDCIVPFSGGKDSAAIALRLKNDYGLNPLLVTYSPMIETEEGRANREAVIRYGFDNIFFRPNQEVSRKLARRFLIERGNPEVHRAAGINSLPLQEAVRRGIKLVVYAEHGESMYGGLVLSEEHRKFRILDEVLEHQVGDHPLNWAGDDVSEKELAPYLYPDLEAVERVGVKATYFGYWRRWDVRENLAYVDRHVPFTRALHGRSEGTWSDYDSIDDMVDPAYFHLQHVKFGFGRALRDAARAIQNGHMTREEALPLIEKYDGEWPTHSLRPFCEYVRMNEDEYAAVIDKHRNAEIWEKHSQGWELRHKPW